MALVEMNWNPPTRQLRQFGGICAVALPALAWFWGGGAATILVAGAAGVIAVFAGWYWPRLLRPVFVAVSLVAFPLGLVVAELAMLAMFFLVFVPIGLLFWLVKRDSLNLAVDRRARTYWQPKSQPKNIASYYRQS